MRLGSRLGILSIISTLLPVAGLGVWTAHSRFQNYFENIAQQQLYLSRGSAFYVHTWLESIENDITRHVSMMEDNSQTKQEFIRTILNDSSGNLIAGIFDESGIDIIPHQKKDNIDSQRFLNFRSEVQEAIDNEQLGFLDVYSAHESFIYLRRLNQNEYFAIDIGLKELEDTLSKQKTDEIEILLLSKIKGKVLGAATTLSPELVLRRCNSKQDEFNIQYITQNEHNVIASCSPVEKSPWYVFVGSDTESFAATGQTLWTSTLIVCSLAGSISLLLSGLFIRRLTDPLERLVDAARTIAMGGFGQRVYYHRNDEIGELADAFNMMSAALDQYSNDFQRQAEILSQTNADLQNRVEERTKELKRAQEKLIQSARLAAVGEMGAGLAHSLNNPLSAVLGSLQILELSYPDEELITMLRDESKRCKEIVQQWLEASQSLDSEVERNHEELSLRDVVRRTSKSVSNYLEQRDVIIETSEVEDFMFWGDSRIIEQAFTQFFYALRPHVEKGNNIIIKAFVQSSLAIVRVRYKEAYLSDDERKAAGMFYWTAIHYFSTHHVEVKEVKEKEYQWTIHIPKGRSTYE